MAQSSAKTRLTVSRFDPVLRFTAAGAAVDSPERGNGPTDRTHRAYRNMVKCRKHWPGVGIYLRFLVSVASARRAQPIRRFGARDALPARTKACRAAGSVVLRHTISSGVRLWLPPTESGARFLIDGGVRPFDDCASVGLTNQSRLGRSRASRNRLRPAWHHGLWAALSIERLNGFPPRRGSTR